MQDLSSKNTFRQLLYGKNQKPVVFIYFSAISIEIFLLSGEWEMK